MLTFLHFYVDIHAKSIRCDATLLGNLKENESDRSLETEENGIQMKARNGMKTQLGFL